jgi:hypothetical protein
MCNGDACMAKGIEVVLVVLVVSSVELQAGSKGIKASIPEIIITGTRKLLHVFPTVFI